ncbi:MAG: hypothetical protein ACI9V1_003321 [Spirosomataceae bacterium]|jgi:hypothetical protein
MKQSVIYKITVSQKYSALYIRESEPIISYYSNLKRTVEAIQTTLAVQGWDKNRVNYSAVYRAIKERSKYVEDFNAEGTKFFQLIVEKVILNPSFTTLGIETSPIKQT